MPGLSPAAAPPALPSSRLKSLVGRDSVRLRQRARAAGQIWRNPVVALKTFWLLQRKVGTPKALKKFREGPHYFGKLRGFSFMGFASPSRRRAMQAADTFFQQMQEQALREEAAPVPKAPA